MSATYFFGEIAGQPIGSRYPDRLAAAAAGVHQVTQQGIAGNRDVGCASIAVNNGYDNEDYGDNILYTGSGGQDPKRRGTHIADQELSDSDNAALVYSQASRLPIRVLRGPNGDPAYAPTAGYRYDGLYRVVAHWPHYPADGFRRWRFHLVRLTAEEATRFTPAENVQANLLAPALPEPTPVLDQPAAELTMGEPMEMELPSGNEAPSAMVRYVVRIVRDTAVAAAVKRIYDQACQVCGDRLKTKNGFYVEGAHIRPLGKPHYGPDTMANILSLCPNHHALFDKGGLYLSDNLQVFDADGTLIGDLTVARLHELDRNQVRYHRGHHGFPSDA